MLTQMNQSVRGAIKTSLLILSILCSLSDGKFYIGKLKEEISLVQPPDLLPAEDQSR